MKVLLIASLALSAFPALAEIKTYDLTDFTKIEVSDGVGATVIVGQEFMVETEALRGNLDRLNVDQYGDRLTISRKESGRLFGVGKRDRFEVTVTLPELIEVESAAGSSVHVRGDIRTLVSAESASGSTLTLDEASLGEIDLQASSGSTLRATGSCTHVDAQSNSGSTLVVSALECETAKLESSSGSTLRAYATDTAELVANSGSSLHLAGGAKIEEQVVNSGASVQVD